MVNKKAEGAPEGAAIPQKYLVKIPGVISTHTTSFSLQQAVAYALHQAFENRNEFLFEGKKFIGELGLQQLTSTILEDPKVFDFVQELPGLPSQPLSIPLPPAQPTLSAPAPMPAPAPVASIDIDKLLVHAARYNIHPRQVADYVQRAANAYRLSGEDQDHLAHVLYNYKVGQSLPDLKVQGEEGKWLKKADEQLGFPEMGETGVPADFAVQPLKPGEECEGMATCGICGLSWDDSIPTQWTPAPSARCPFEYFHDDIANLQS